jgi:hypothetical protein
MARVTRRRFLATGAMAGASLLGVPGVATSPRKEIVMLGIWPFTGPFADVGPLLDRGMRLAIDEWGNKVVGRPIKYITRDSETKASAATRRMEGDRLRGGQGRHRSVVERRGPCVYRGGQAPESLLLLLPWHRGHRVRLGNTNALRPRSFAAWAPSPCRQPPRLQPDGP